MDYLGCVVSSSSKKLCKTEVPESKQTSAKWRWEGDATLSWETHRVSLFALLDVVSPRAPVICRAEVAHHSRTNQKTGLPNVQQGKAVRAGSVSPKTQVPETRTAVTLNGCPPSWVLLPWPIPQVGISPHPGRHRLWGTESNTEMRTGKIATSAIPGSARAAWRTSRLRGLVHHASAARHRAHSRIPLRARALSPTDLVRRGPQLGTSEATPAAQQQPQPQMRRDELPSGVPHGS